MPSSSCAGGVELSALVELSELVELSAGMVVLAASEANVVVLSPLPAVLLPLLPVLVVLSKMGVAGVDREAALVLLVM